MHFITLFPSLILLPLATTAPTTQTHFHSTQIPTRYESTVLGRRLLALSSYGAISTIFPPSSDPDPNPNAPSLSPLSTPPSSVGNLPISLPEYVASCEEPSGNPTLLLLDVSTPSRNLQSPLIPAERKNLSLSLSWADEYAVLTGLVSASPASLPRLSLVGYVEEIPLKKSKGKGGVDSIEGCFVEKHPDAGFWVPGRKGSPHSGKWWRLVVQEVYWIGGFGDTNWIGWFDVLEWRAVKKEEWEGVRLPGEKN